MQSSTIIRASCSNLPQASAGSYELLLRDQLLGQSLQSPAKGIVRCARVRRHSLGHCPFCRHQWTSLACMHAEAMMILAGPSVTFQPANHSMCQSRDASILRFGRTPAKQPLHCGGDDTATCSPLQDCQTPLRRKCAAPRAFTQAPKASTADDNLRVAMNKLSEPAGMHAWKLKR